MGSRHKDFLKKCHKNNSFVNARSLTREQITAVLEDTSQEDFKSFLLRVLKQKDELEGLREFHRSSISNVRAPTVGVSPRLGISRNQQQQQIAIPTTGGMGIGMGRRVSFTQNVPFNINSEHDSILDHSDLASYVRAASQQSIEESMMNPSTPQQQQQLRYKKGEKEKEKEKEDSSSSSKEDKYKEVDEQIALAKQGYEVDSLDFYLGRDKKIRQSYSKAKLAYKKLTGDELITQAEKEAIYERAAKNTLKEDKIRERIESNPSLAKKFGYGEGVSGGDGDPNFFAPITSQQLGKIYENFEKASGFGKEWGKAEASFLKNIYRMAPVSIKTGIKDFAKRVYPYLSFGASTAAAGIAVYGYAPEIVKGLYDHFAGDAGSIAALRQAVQIVYENGGEVYDAINGYVGWGTAEPLHHGSEHKDIERAICDLELPTNSSRLPKETPQQTSLNPNYNPSKIYEPPSLPMIKGDKNHPLAVYKPPTEISHHHTSHNPTVPTTTSVNENPLTTYKPPPTTSNPAAAATQQQAAPTTTNNEGDKPKKNDNKNQGNTTTNTLTKPMSYVDEEGKMHYYETGKDKQGNNLPEGTMLTEGGNVVSTGLRSTTAPMSQRGREQICEEIMIKRSQNPAELGNAEERANMGRGAIPTGLPSDYPKGVVDKDLYFVKGVRKRKADNSGAQEMSIWATQNGLRGKRLKNSNKAIWGHYPDQNKWERLYGESFIKEGSKYDKLPYEKWDPRVPYGPLAQQEERLFNILSTYNNQNLGATYSADPSKTKVESTVGGSKIN